MNFVNIRELASKLRMQEQIWQGQLELPGAEGKADPRTRVNDIAPGMLDCPQRFVTKIGARSLRQ